jgi:hypothetical protein
VQEREAREGEKQKRRREEVGHCEGEREEMERSEGACAPERYRRAGTKKERARARAGERE